MSDEDYGYLFRRLQDPSFRRSVLVFDRIRRTLNGTTKDNAVYEAIAYKAAREMLKNEGERPLDQRIVADKSMVIDPDKVAKSFAAAMTEFLVENGDLRKDIDRFAQLVTR